MNVLITRSQPGADVLAAAVRAAGMTAVVAPLFEIVPVDDGSARSTIMDLDRFDVAIVVSTHAVTCGLPLIDAYWPQLPRLTWLAVGHATAAALAGWGVLATVPEPQSSEGILQLPELENLNQRRVLVLCGRGGRQLIEEVLRARQGEVVRLEVYERRPSSTDGVMLEATRPDAVVVSSAEAGERLVNLWPGVVDRPLVVPSERIAESLFKRGGKDVRVSAGAGADAVIDVLRKIRMEL